MDCWSERNYGESTVLCLQTPSVLQSSCNIYPFLRHHCITQEDKLNGYGLPESQNAKKLTTVKSHFTKLVHRQSKTKCTSMYDPLARSTSPVQISQSDPTQVSGSDHGSLYSVQQSSEPEDFFSACHDDLIKECKPEPSQAISLEHISNLKSNQDYGDNNESPTQDRLAVPSSTIRKDFVSKPTHHTSKVPKHSSSFSWLKKKNGNSVEIPSQKCPSQYSQTTYPTLEDLKCSLTYQDYTEINDLQNFHNQMIFENPTPFRNHVSPDNFEVFYSTFLRRRAKFFIGCPRYKTLGVKDKEKLLRVAIYLSTLVTAAHLIDCENFTWPKKERLPESLNEPVVSTNTLRQLFTRDQFINFMLFSRYYSTLLADPRVAVLLQTLGLFYLEPGVQDITLLEAGRHYYIGLLSRYLIAVHGPEIGQQQLQMLLESQHEARQLAESLLSVEIIHKTPIREFINAKTILVEGVRLVCDGAKETLLRMQKKKRKETYYNTDNDKFYRHKKYRVTASDNGSCVVTIEKLNFIQSTLFKLANCTDHEVLSTARRIIPVDLLKRLLQQLQESPNRLSDIS